ncbi:MAG: hypothetical protein NWR64_06500 [Haliea sp.]|nr:hypothetical protein [Haliea sp.]
MNRLLKTIEQRLDALFLALAEGLDAPPGRRLRLEGLLEAAALLELASEESLSALLASRYEAAFARPVHADFGEDWQCLFPFPQIPAMQHRAPVVPTTADDL